MNKEKFVEWFFENFNVEWNDRNFVQDVIENLVDYANQTFHTRDEILYFISKILDEVSFEEAAMFCSDDILTGAAVEQKVKAASVNWKEDGVPETVLCNTRISYLYRDASNYKVLNQEIIPGVLSKTKIKEMLALCDGGEYFIPSQVGLPETRFGEVTEDDHPWFEISEDCFELTKLEPTIDDVTAESLYTKWMAVNGAWDDLACLGY